MGNDEIPHTESTYVAYLAVEENWQFLPNSSPSPLRCGTGRRKHQKCIGAPAKVKTNFHQFLGSKQTAELAL